MLLKYYSEDIKGRRKGGHLEGQKFDSGRFQLAIDFIDTYSMLKVEH